MDKYELIADMPENVQIVLENDGEDWPAKDGLKGEKGES